MSTMFDSSSLQDEFFEGAEKSLDLWFSGLTGRGLREIKRSEWDQVLREVGAKIMSCTKFKAFDSYVLSESSLFVWDQHMVLKTCGSTAPVSAYPLLNKIILNYFPQRVLKRAFYSHKSFMEPERQKFPHRTAREEEKFIKKMFPKGKFLHFKPNELKESHWSIYIYEDPDQQTNKESKLSFMVQLMMTDLGSDVLEKFSSSTYHDPKRDMRMTGIDSLVAGAEIDDQVFDPYGYSMNGCKGDNYLTVHVTPQPTCSYSSFEADLPSLESAESCVKALKIFKPGNYGLSVVCHNDMEKEAAEFMVVMSHYRVPFRVHIATSSTHTIFYAWF